MDIFPDTVVVAAFFRSEINSYLSISVIASISGTSLESSRKTEYTDDA